MRIKVTQAHINKGLHRTVSLCPIALAVKEAVPDTRVMVGTNDVQVGERYADLPTKARKFVYEFDNRRAVEPFNFHLKV